MNQLIYQIQNQHLMSTAQIKEDLHRQIEQGDNRFLRILHAMTVAYAAEHQEEEISAEEIQTILPPQGKHLTMQELLSEIKEADVQIDRGEFVTSEELEKEMEKW